MLYVEQAELHTARDDTSPADFASESHDRLKRFESEWNSEHDSRYHAVRALYHKMIAHAHDMRVHLMIMTKQHDSKELLRGLQAMNVHLQQSRRICIEYKVDDPVVLAEVAQTWFNWYGKVLIPAVFPHASDFMKRNDLKICTSLTLQLEPREVGRH